MMLTRTLQAAMLRLADEIIISPSLQATCPHVGKTWAPWKKKWVIFWPDSINLWKDNFHTRTEENRLHLLVRSGRAV